MIRRLPLTHRTMVAGVLMLTESDANYEADALMMSQ